MENHKETCRTLIKILTGKEHVYFVDRGNKAIQISLEIVKHLGRQTCLFQEEGGWLRYEKFIKAAELEPIKLVTNYGLIYEQELKNYSHDGVLLLNSLAGYIALHDMEKVFNACITNDVFLINDVSGSIGTPEAKFGEIIIGSFGKGKPVNVGSGGFVALEEADWIEKIEEAELDFEKLEEKLRGLEKRRQFLISKAKKVKEDLKDQDIVHRDEEGLNVVIKFSSEEEKNKLLKYCDDKKLEHTICPREIRILEDAVSIEIKRLI